MNTRASSLQRVACRGDAGSMCAKLRASLKFDMSNYEYLRAAACFFKKDSIYFWFLGFFGFKMSKSMIFCNIPRYFYFFGKSIYFRFSDFSVLKCLNRRFFVKNIAFFFLVIILSKKRSIFDFRFFSFQNAYKSMILWTNLRSASFLKKSSVYFWFLFFSVSKCLRGWKKCYKLVVFWVFFRKIFDLFSIFGFFVSKCLQRWFS